MTMIANEKVVTLLHRYGVGHWLRDVRELQEGDPAAAKGLASALLRRHRKDLEHGVAAALQHAFLGPTVR